MGVLDRLVLSDAAWERMAPLIIGRPDQKGSTGRDNRMFVEGVLWIVRTGSPWRDLPDVFGEWNSVFRRFQSLEPQGCLVAYLRGDERRSGLRIPDRRLHHHPRSPTCRRGEKRGSEDQASDQALGRSRGGLSTKIHMAVRGLGCPVRLILTGGHRGDAPQAIPLIEGLAADAVMADTAYDSDQIREAIAEKGAVAAIPNNPSRAKTYKLDKHLYAQRHLVECCFSRLKQFRRVATRYEKTARNYLAIVTLAATVLWLR